MTDFLDEYERLLENERTTVENAANNFNFSTGDIFLEIDKSLTEAGEYLTVDNGRSSVDNSRVFDYSRTKIDGSRFFDDTRITDNSRSETRNSRETTQNYGGVSGLTVNFNAYNKISSSADIDAVMTAFGEKLAEAVASAAEGIHI
ncbi:MAG: hypothetical protein LBI38_03645 [Oscillospiraceae bacterium]|nr:hypothetical protein [Oscillospiraceae bacterium]